MNFLATPPFNYSDWFRKNDKDLLLEDDQQ